MPKIAYEPWKPGQDAIDVIAEAEQIARSYQAQGFDLTLRQLYYQFVSRDLMPNHDRSYKRLGSILNRARMAGLFDWSIMVDRTRNIAGIGYFQTPDDLVRNLALYHSVDHWQDQDDYMEVWVEKEALAGVVQRAAEEFNVPYFSCRGYVSQSELWGAAQRLRRQVENGKRVTILHLGDHDPSGIDMTRDITDRVRTFTTQDFLNAWTPEVARVAGSVYTPGEGVTATTGDIQRAMAARTVYPENTPIEVRRIALNMDQIEEYGPPPNPAKMTDSRVANYLDEYGDQSWELDALDPSTLVDLIQGEIRQVIDLDRWERHDETQRQERERLQFVADNWERISREYDES